MVSRYDLRSAPWLPLRRRGGEGFWGNPSMLADDLGGNPVAALATSRPDFDGAVLECLIGLYTAAFLLKNEDEWRQIWRSPPTPAFIAQRLAELPDAFSLDGEGPRFMQ